MICNNGYFIINKFSNLWKKYIKGQNLYKKTLKIIPGGVQLLSKDQKYFVWSMGCYYKSAKGCEILTYDNIKLMIYQLPEGMCPLGYAHPVVNKV